MPLLIETVPVFLFEGGPPEEGADLMALAEEGAVTQSEPNAYLAGIDTSRLDQFDDLESVDGDVIPLAEIGENEVVISERMADRYEVSDDRKHVGFDAYKKVLADPVDMVILTTPPYFRPFHFAAAIAAGKHVFFEKPVAVDPAGIRQVIAAGKQATFVSVAIPPGTTDVEEYLVSGVPSSAVRPLRF